MSKGVKTGEQAKPAEQEVGKKKASYTRSSKDRLQSVHVSSGCAGVVVAPAGCTSIACFVVVLLVVKK